VGIPARIGGRRLSMEDPDATAVSRHGLQITAI